MAEGVPEDVALNERSYTGQYLKPLLERATRNELPRHRPGPEQVVQVRRNYTGEDLKPVLARKAKAAD